MLVELEEGRERMASRTLCTAIALAGIWGCSSDDAATKASGTRGSAALDGSGDGKSGAGNSGNGGAEGGQGGGASGRSAAHGGRTSQGDRGTTAGASAEARWRPAPGRERIKLAFPFFWLSQPLLKTFRRAEAPTATRTFDTC